MTQMVDVCNLYAHMPAAGQPSSFGILTSSWMGLTVLALMVSLLFLLLFYMLAQFFRDSRLIAWSKFELYQILATTALFIITGTLLWGMCTFDMSIFNSQWGTKNIYQISDDYLAKVGQVGSEVFVYLLYFVNMLGQMHKTTLLGAPLGIGGSENPLESFGQINNLIFYLMSAFMTSWVMLDVQRYMLKYLAYACLMFLYPFGVFFRAFQPTRSFGGTLIGMSLALFFFYPVIIVMNDYMMFGATPQTDRQVTIDKLANEIQRLDAEAAAQGKAGADVSEIIAKNPGTTLKDIQDAQAMNAGITGGMMFLIRPLALYSIAAAMLPILDFIILVEITRALTHALGEEVDVSNLTRLI